MPSSILDHQNTPAGSVGRGHRELVNFQNQELLGSRRPAKGDRVGLGSQGAEPLRAADRGPGLLRCPPTLSPPGKPQAPSSTFPGCRDHWLPWWQRWSGNETLRANATWSKLSLAMATDWARPAQSGQNHQGGAQRQGLLSLSQIQGYLQWSCPHAWKRPGNKVQRGTGHPPHRADQAPPWSMAP